MSVDGESAGGAEGVGRGHGDRSRIHGKGADASDASGSSAHSILPCSIAVFFLQHPFHYDFEIGTAELIPIRGSSWLVPGFSILPKVPVDSLHTL